MAKHHNPFTKKDSVKPAPIAAPEKVEAIEPEAESVKVAAEPKKEIKIDNQAGLNPEVPAKFRKFQLGKGN